MRSLNAALLLPGKDYSSFHELTYEAMMATTKGYACTIVTMLYFLEVNNPNHSKFESLAKELESEMKQKAAEEEIVKAESERLKAEDAFKNMEREF